MFNMFIHTIEIRIIHIITKISQKYWVNLGKILGEIKIIHKKVKIKNYFLSDNNDINLDPKYLHNFIWIWCGI